VKIGVTLPQFTERAADTIDAAARAEGLGLDGVFCFDHLWPIGEPDGPALSIVPLLGALAGSTSTISIGTLVARVGLLPDSLLSEVLVTAWEISDGRFIAGLGTGDRLSRPENEAFGIPFESADERRARVRRVATVVQDRGIPVWVGGGEQKTIELARSLGATANLWEAAPETVAALVESGLEVTWGGPLGRDRNRAEAMLGALAVAGATWAVCAWPESLELVADVAFSVKDAL
jgi:alkanesulfonate monooxygenase SsuD/methylene tetrahydromethanopterin reductase-like flavin-dependent oxidoreductase (luciferase family)